MGRWLRTSVAGFALALVGCAHRSPAAEPPPPPLAASAPPPGVPPELKKVAAAIPACGGVPADVVDAARIKEAPLGSRVSVRGFLVPGDMECGLIAYSTVDPDTGERRPLPCANTCGGFLLLAAPDGATATIQAPGATQILLRPTGSVRPLETGGNECVIDALAASPHEEIIASGRLEPAPPAPERGVSARDARLIDYATLCATGRWTPPRANADGGLPPDVGGGSSVRFGGSRR